MSENHKKIVIQIPSFILGIEDLNDLEKLMLSVTHTFSKRKLGFNSLSNKAFSEMLGVDINSLGTHRKNLVTLGYERKEKGGIYYLTDKTNELKTVSNRSLLIPPQVYTLRKLKAGAKLLWGEYNSRCKGKLGYCNAKREILAKSIQCHEDSITNWHNKLEEMGLLEYSELASGTNTRQRRVKTKFFSKENTELIPTVNPLAVQPTENDDTNKAEDNVQQKPKDEAKAHGGSIEQAPIQNRTVVSVEHSEENLNWRKYMHDLHSVDLSCKVEREDFVWELTEKMYRNKDDQQTVFTSIHNSVDTEVKDKKLAKLLKDELINHIVSP